ncbi:putative btb poz domain containing protein [Diaporthe ampelina]|uniref:Putative btb poz domain containing protein n=1 Tax=Diaporthe ampelina TaxID=1214573 RepID=A0A0G2FNE4_9PEZI|nr:putative btb poz domain containing protein [Diaporthe ampelina]
MFGRSRKASVSQTTTKSKPPSTAVTRDSGVSKRRPSTASRRRPSNACSAQSLVDPSGKWVSPEAQLHAYRNSPIITLVVGREARIFAAHEEVLTKSPVLAAALRSQYMEPTGKRITLPDEEPEVLSPILEYLYKGDYSPRLVHNKRRDTWEIESNDEATIFHQATGAEILKDTVIYCAAEKYKLDELKRIALRKQGLRTGIPCGIILSSARFAYANTSDSDSKLRAHYLALIIRSRSTFKRSGTMQQEMFNGGSQLFFDLFVALANHVDDIQSPRGTPRSGTPKNGFF